MKKTPSLFKRDFKTGLVYNEVVEGSEWVQKGEGRATRKFDGTACLIEGGKLFKRYDVKSGKKPPADFKPAQEPDPVTGHWPGWVPVGDGPDDKWHREAFHEGLPDGTYELCGPKVQGNPEGYETHVLILHGLEELADVPTEFKILKAFLQPIKIEGIVWHHPDGRMVKIKRKDFFK